VEDFTPDTALIISDCNS